MNLVTFFLQNKEPVGDDSGISTELSDNLASLTQDTLKVNHEACPQAGLPATIHPQLT